MEIVVTSVSHFCFGSDDARDFLIVGRILPCLDAAPRKTWVQGGGDSPKMVMMVPMESLVYGVAGHVTWGKAGTPLMNIAGIVAIKAMMNL